MTGLFRVISWAEKTGAFLAALSIALLFILGLSEILLRTFAGYSLPVSLEYSGYLVAFSFFLGLGWTLSEGKHIRLALFEKQLGPARMLDLTATLLALVIVTVFTIALITWAAGSYTKGTVSFFPSATPLWIPQAIFSIGPFILTLSVLGRLLRLVLKLPENRQ